MSPLPAPPWATDPARPPALPEAARRFAAAALRAASALLARWARRLGAPSVSRRGPVPRLEFYAEAGAPEGALYADGVLVGRVDGVRRL